VLDRLGGRATAGSLAEAIDVGTVVLLAVPRAAVEEIAAANAHVLSGKVVVDATNAFGPKGFSTAMGTSSWTASRMPGARVVKAFNTVNYAKLAAEAHRGGDAIAIPVASDDEEAARVVEQLVRDAGFEPVLVGSLSAGAGFEPGSPFFNSGITAAELRRWLALPGAKRPTQEPPP
jgi:predicted dinucleotide-binding enzyme